MIALKSNNLTLQILKETGKSIITISALYLANQTLSNKLKDITKDAGQTVAQGLRYIRIKSRQED